MALPVIVPADVVAAANIYIRNGVNDVAAKRVFVADNLINQTKVWYFLNALAMPDITIQQQYQIYECLIAFTNLY